MIGLGIIGLIFLIVVVITITVIMGIKEDNDN